MISSFRSLQHLLALSLLFLALPALPALPGLPAGLTPASAQVHAQSLDGTDLSGVRSADITDAQLRNYVDRARAEGISEAEAFNLARQRGLPASEAGALRSRLREMEDEPAGDTDTVGRERDEPTAEPEDRPAPRETDPETRRTFGAEVFREDGIAFEPSRQVPTPETYDIGPGDEIVVDVWGEATNVHRLEVSPEGTVTIDHLGPVYLNGLTIREAEERVLEKLQTLYSGLRPGSGNANTFARVSLGRLRSIQVTMAGEVSTPGDYTVSSLSTVYNALYMAGGPNRRGSFRSIRVIRENRVVSELDLYDFLIRGDQSDNIRLQDQDVIMIDPFERRVEITGEVKRTGYFQMNEDETLADLIRFAGNFTARAYTRQLRVHRNTPVERAIVSVKQEDIGRFGLRNGDAIFVDEILDRFENRVRISGAVWRGGEFELTEGMTLYELIAEADGLRPDAYLTRGIINRLKDDFSFELVSFDVRRLMEDPGTYDIPLRREDQVRIQSIFDMREELTVRIGGAVQNDTIAAYRENMTLEDLILMADGFRESASEARIEVARRIIGEAAPEQRGTQLAEMFTFDVSRDLQLREEDKRFELQPFDQVFVRQRPDYTTQRSIRIEGQVLYPGTYVIESRNERISDVIARSGGLTDEAYLPGATLIRRTERGEAELDFVVDDETVDRGGREGRIGIDLPAIMARPGSPDDLLIRQGDVIRIPDELQTVRISGAVMQDIEVRFREGRGLRYYIDHAGGYTEQARTRRAYVIYANGDVDRRKNYIWGLFRSLPDIEPGAEIIIPEKRDRERMSTGEIISISSAVVSMASTVAIMIDRLSR